MEFDTYRRCVRRLTLRGTLLTCRYFHGGAPTYFTGPACGSLTDSRDGHAANNDNELPYADVELVVVTGCELSDNDDKPARRPAFISAPDGQQRRGWSVDDSSRPSLYHRRMVSRTSLRKRQSNTWQMREDPHSIAFTPITDVICWNVRPADWQ